ncbi:MAG: copper amine oxidase N-terminal domain-containing protein [Oscillospiraceae bacterium]|nr:copper amine oxidase N-terminal domain-containing protein [Oscillospiraceae bacterium]
MKKIIFTVAVIFFVAVFSIPVYAGSGVNVTIDGVPVIFEGQNPILVEGRTLIPVRGVFEKLGFDVQWDSSTGMVTLESDRHFIALTIDSAIFTSNGGSYALDVPMQLVGGSAMIPLRAALENVLFDLSWDAATRTVVISTQRPNRPTDLVKIIGEERAALLTPVDINVHSERDETLEHGISIEFMAVAFHDNLVDVYLTLRDLYDCRLDGDFHISFTIDRDLHAGRVFHGRRLNIPGFFVQPSSTLEYELIYRDEITGNLTFFIRQKLSVPFYYSGSIPVTVNSIFHNPREFFDVEIPIDLRYVERGHPVIPHPHLRESGSAFTPSGHPIPSASLRDDNILLTPGSSGLDIGIEGLEVAISSIGVVGNNLRVQIYNLPPEHRPAGGWDTFGDYAGFSEIVLYDYGGRRIDGRQFWFVHGDERIQHVEFVFPIDVDSLESYRLIGNFKLVERIPIYLTQRVSSPDSTPRKVVDDLSIKMSENVIVREIRLNSYSLFLAVNDFTPLPPVGQRYSKVDPGLIAINAQGIINVKSWDQSQIRDGIRGVSFSFDTENGFLNLDTVTGIEIAGELIDIAAGAKHPLNEISVLLNDRPITFEGQQPEVSGGLVRVPLYTVFEAMGFEVAKVYYLPYQSGEPVEVINICDGETTIVLMEGHRSTITVNNRRILSVAHIYPRNETLMMPISIISRTGVAQAHWDDATRTVSIVTVQEAPNDSYLEFSSRRLWDRHHNFGENHIEVITSEIEFSKLNLFGISYPQEFFEDNTLVAVFTSRIGGSAFLQSIDERGSITFEAPSCNDPGRQSIFLIELCSEVAPSRFVVEVVNTCPCWRCEWMR